MKKILKGFVIAISLALVSISAQAETFVLKQGLDQHRTSMDYAIQVREFINNVEHHKWEASNGESFYFIQTEKPFDHPTVNENMFLTVETYFYGQKTGSELFYLVEGKFEGFLDMVDFRNSTRVNIRFTEDGNIQVLNSSRKLNTYKIVKKWSENPKPLPETKTAEEQGLIF